MGRGNTTNKIKENQKGATKKSTKRRGNGESLVLASCSTWREMRAGPATPGPGRDPLPAPLALGDILGNPREVVGI